MKIEICKWYNGATSPVLFFIDDFANVWVDTNGSGQVDLEEDWGYAKDGENSSFRYLYEVILKDFPGVKTTFFVPVGVRVGVIESPEIQSISKMINCDEETKSFFKSVHDDERFEIAYHGTTHGKVGKTTSDFKHEWELFNSIDEATETINRGKGVYKEVFGDDPKGGKYCGYRSNEYSDESIDRAGFIWWCRFENIYTSDMVNTDKYNKFIYGEDSNEITNNEIKTFGTSGVVDIPSTINGNFLTGLFTTNKKTLKGLAKVLLKGYLSKKRRSKVDFLLENNLVISIQEHMAPSRDDGRRQGPNIFDDHQSIKYIFNYLKTKNVWYCTGTELAEYYILKENIKLTQVSDCSFKINYIGNTKLSHMIISLKFDKSILFIREPSGKKIYDHKGIYNIKVIDGLYKIMEG